MYTLSHSASARPQARGRRIAIAAAAIFALLTGVAAAAPAYAAGSLTISKLVNGEQSAALVPDQEFTYSIQVGCSDDNCQNAQMTDVLPAEFDGFAILGTQVSPGAQPSTITYDGCSTAVTAACELTVDFKQPLSAGVTGISSGTTFSVAVTLKVPASLSPSWSSNGAIITNTATATADNAPSVSDAADVTITVPIVVDTTVTKAWSPATQQFSPGVASTVTLTTANTSNVAASSLSLQDPSVAPDGAATLDAGNPFALVDFSGFGSLTAPQGADRVQVDAYVLSGGTWSWVTGTPSSIAAIALPGVVSAADVGGLRLTFSDSAGGATIISSGTAGSVPLAVAQRSTNRSTGASLVLGSSVTNQVAGTVTVPGQQPVTETASAPYTIGGLTVAVDATKQIAPNRIPAGTSATATISGKNTSNGPLSTLVLADTDFFTDSLKFGGFTLPVAYPTGATGATIEWQFSDGSTVPAAVAAGSSPAAPAAPGGAHLTGFTMTFAGAVAANATATLAFAISPDADFAQGQNPTRVTNTVDVTGTNPAGTFTDPASAPLDVFDPEIRLTLDKTTSPAGAVQAGGTVVAQLPTVTSSDSAFVNPTSIVVEDSLRPGAGDFWNAFNPIAIAPTQVSAGVGMLVEYTVDGTNWVTLATVPASPTASVYQSSINSALAPTIEGLRFTFTDTDGFPRGTTVSPNVVFEARSTLRSTPGTSTSVPGAPASVYENRAVASGSGEVEGPTTITSTPVQDLADASIISFNGNGTLIAAKNWRTPTFSASKDTINSQSGEQAGTRLGWGVLSTGYSSVTVTDSASDEGQPENTVFQAFDLDRIPATSYSADPLLRWDTISIVELYYNGVWNTVAAPGGSWMNGTGFKGYDLPTNISDITTGVRITVVPNDTARAASTAPVTPPVGSGVATSASGQVRTLDLLWTLRNVVRVPAAPLSDWVNASHGYNDPLGSSNAVYNSVAVAGVQNGTPVGPLVESDQIVLIDQPPGVDVAKTASVTSIPIPNNVDVAPGDYPSVTFSVTSSNTSSARASYLRITDPQPCATGSETDCLSAPTDWASDPFTAPYSADNPFERLNLTDIGFTVNTTQVDSTQSRVTLLLRDATGTLSTQEMSLQAAANLGAASLVDVVGVSVVYQGTDPATRGGSIASGTTQVMTLTAQVRKELRSQPGTLVTPFTVDNYAFAQSYDPVLAPSGATSTPSDGAHDDVVLIAGTLGVTATKTISPATLVEKDRTTPVTVTLGATPGAATVATNEVVIDDSDPEFWSSFRLTGLGAVTLPAGADRVRVDVRTGGSATWQNGVAGPAAVLPAIDLATVTGIRFVFTRADADVFSHTAPPASWNAQAILNVALLDTLRGTSTAVPFPSTVDNQVATRSERYDAPAIYAPATATAADDIVLDPGTFRLDVAKSPRNNQHTVFPGDTIPWTLTFGNDGTGFLTIDDLVDTLPAELNYDGELPVFATSAGGTLSTDVDYVYDSAARTLTFSWPDGGDRMSPDETFTITLGLILAPGLTPAQRATNSMVVTTGQNLTSCTNLSGNAQGVLTGLPAQECGTTNYVAPIAGATLVTDKSVRGDVAGPGLVPAAVNVSDAQGSCVADSEGFYRSPCAANSVIGGTDEWKLEAVNSGTVAYTSLTFVDPLPTPGDRMLATGGSRGSTYRPVFDGAAGVQVTGAPAGTTQTLQVSTTDKVCVGTGASTWPSNPTCSTATWVALGAYAGDWADVTGVRLVLDFTTSAAGSLAPAGQVVVKYRTTNVVETAVLPDRAPSEVPVTGNYAWNQFGAVATLTAGAPIQRAPSKAGVTLLGGPLQVTKTITGAATAYAPGQYLVDVDCAIGATALDLGTEAVLELNNAGLYTARIDGIPLGAQCVIAEQGAVGAFGESSRSGTPSTVDITSAAAGTDPVPVAQRVAVVNDYAFGALSITKDVTTQATVGTFGPFEFSLSCETVLGSPIVLSAADRQFDLADGATHTVAANTLPIGAECILTETDSADADGVTITGTGVIDAGNGSATVTVGSASSATVTNLFEAGTLSVLKTVAGTGAAYGTGPFSAQVRCVYGTPEQVLFDGLVALVPAIPTLVGNVFPAGTVCAVAETTTGGANSHIDPPAVVITGPASGQTVGSVTADVTNYFSTGSLEIQKVRTGDGVAAFGAGPFTVEVTCTWDRDGTAVTIPLPGGGVMTLTAANGYAATVDDLLVGATCVVEETDAGLATATTLLPTDGAVTIVDPAVIPTPATVIITNRFDVGHLSLSKTASVAVAGQGEAVPYTITVTNDGQVDAHDFTVTDTLPAGSTLVSAEDGGVLGNGVVTWKIHELKVGQSTSVHLGVSFAQPGLSINHATIQVPPGPWRLPTLANECDGGFSCATVLITALAFTGSGLGWAMLAGPLALLVGAALLLLAELRRRRTVTR